MKLLIFMQNPKIIIIFKISGLYCLGVYCLTFKQFQSNIHRDP